MHSETRGEGDRYNLKTYYWVTISSSTCRITFLYHLLSFCGVSIVDA